MAKIIITYFDIINIDNTMSGSFKNIQLNTNLNCTNLLFCFLILIIQTLSAKTILKSREDTNLENEIKL